MSRGHSNVSYEECCHALTLVAYVHVQRQPFEGFLACEVRRIAYHIPTLENPCRRYLSVQKFISNLSAVLQAPTERLRHNL